MKDSGHKLCYKVVESSIQYHQRVFKIVFGYCIVTINITHPTKIRRLITTRNTIAENKMVDFAFWKLKIKIHY